MPTQKQLKLYIGCALTQAPDQFKTQVENFKDTLREDFHIMDFLGLVTGTPQDVFHHDIRTNVADCDLFVAICDYPSIGLGYELASAIEKYKKPVLAVAHQDAHVTRLVIGIDDPAFTFERYNEIPDIRALIDHKLSTRSLT